MNPSKVPLAVHDGPMVVVTPAPAGSKKHETAMTGTTTTVLKTIIKLNALIPRLSLR